MPRTDIEKGYNIVAGKLSYEISKILDPNGIAPTLVATDLDRVVVPDEQTQGLRKLTLIEQSRLFGFPDDFKLNIKPALAHDLFGNTVPVKVVTAVATLLIRSAFSDIEQPVPILQQKTSYYSGQQLALIA
jgi:DNA (cytosine-5)-methyltransferase 1